jgi:opacity protein-like surface antigen
VFAASGFDGTDEDDEENNLLGTVRGKVGVAFDRVLVYGTGGLALTSADNTAGFIGLGSGSAVATGAGTPFALAFSDVDGDDDDEIALGFSAGGGIDVAVTDNFIIGAQALYFNIEGDDDDGTLACNQALSAVSCVGVPAAAVTGEDNAFEGVIATVRGSYKFNFGGNLLEAAGWN